MKIPPLVLKQHGGISLDSLSINTCSVDGCTRKYKGNGYCNLHYQRNLRHGNPLTITKNMDHGGQCSFVGCDKKYKSNGYCDMHYWRWRNNGDPSIVRRINTYNNRKCLIDGCNKRSKSKNLCNAHYQRLNIYGDASYPLQRTNDHSEICIVKDCNRPYHSKDYCEAHYKRFILKGDVSINVPVIDMDRHGMSYSIEHRSWSAMKSRCNNKNDLGYKYYGARGIKVCIRWRNSFKAFFDDMSKRPSIKYSIDRIDVNGNYSCGKCEECMTDNWPMNCKWSTQEEQMNNMRTNVNLTIDDNTMTISMWAKKYGIGRGAIVYRLSIGKTPKQALGLE